MAKKKYSSKKHKLKHSEASESHVQSAETTGPLSPAAVVAPTKPRLGIVTTTRDFSYVVNDLRRIAVMAVTLIVLQLILWYLLSHTDLGDAIYSLVKI